MGTNTASSIYPQEIPEFLMDRPAVIPLERKPFVIQLAAGIFRWFARLVAVLATIWAFGALWHDFPIAALRMWAVGGFAAAVLILAVVLRGRWQGKFCVLALAALVAGWWFTLQPRQFRDWKPGLALSPYAELDGDEVTIRNVRNFHYRTDYDFEEIFEERKYDLRNLQGVDLFLNHWGSEWIAHPIFSFDFGKQGRICMSVETRQEKGEEYSNTAGFYRAYELAYVAADERDVIRLRTNVRTKEDVYLYHLDGLNARRMFLDYLRTMNELRAAPRWYHAITNNCTTAIRNQHAAGDRWPWDWRIIASGKLDEMLYDRGQISHTLPFPDLRKQARINQAALEADEDAGFSEAIRKGRAGF